MTSVLCIVVVIALAVFVIVWKTCAMEPKKAQKWEKANIMKQLLALSESENGIAAVPPGSGKPRAVPGPRPGHLAGKPGRRASRPASSAQGRC